MGVYTNDAKLNVFQ